MNTIEEFGQRTGRQFSAGRVILFGSGAQGTATRDSDVSFGKIQDLAALLDRAIAVEAGWESFREYPAYLSDRAVIPAPPRGSGGTGDFATPPATRCARSSKPLKDIFNGKKYEET